MKKATIAEIEPLVTECRGNIAAIARRLRVSRGTIHNRIADSTTLQTAIDDAREAFVDSVEAALYDNAIGGNVAAQIFIMKAHPAAKRRGWGERTELTGKDGQPVQHEHEHRGQTHGDIDHLAAVLATLTGVGAVALPDPERGADAEDD